jgi:hypothetical protein
MMRAPGFVPTFTPVEAYKERFSAPGGTALGNTVGRALVIGGADINDAAAMRGAIRAMTDANAGRARALQDKAALASLVDAHTGLNGGDALAGQPLALDELARIRANGQAALATPAMIAAYDQQIGPAIDEAASQITGHALRQAIVERQALADQELQSAQRSAASAWQDPARLVQGLDTVRVLAANQTGPQASSEDRALAERSAAGGAVAHAVGQALDAGEPEFAAHILGGWGHTLSPAAYQLAVARVGQAAQTQRLDTIFAQAAGGNRLPGGADSPDEPASPDSVAIAAPLGAAVHPIAGGTVTAIGGAPDNASVQVQHPDGSTTAYHGLGLAAVATGDLVAPAHAIGSAGPVVTLAANTPTGDPADAGALLRDAGGPTAIIGQTSTPRVWNMPAMSDRIAQRSDLSAEDRALAGQFAHRRMAADQAQQAANDVSAGRSVVSLHAAMPDRFNQAADLPSDLAGQMTPATLAKVDEALRNASRAATSPSSDNTAALRLELLQRQAPDAFAQVNLGPLVGSVHPTDLAQLAASQAALVAGQSPDAPLTSRAAVLDSLARQQIAGIVQLPDDVLAAAHGSAQTLLRINRTDPSDRASIDNTVADAIQSQSGQS